MTLSQRTRASWVSRKVTSSPWPIRLTRTGMRACCTANQGFFRSTTWRSLSRCRTKTTNCATERRREWRKRGKRRGRRGASPASTFQPWPMHLYSGTLTPWPSEGRNFGRWWLLTFQKRKGWTDFGWQNVRTDGQNWRTALKLVGLDVD